MPRPATVTPIAKANTSKPTADYELVKADPPTKDRLVRVTLADRVGPLLDEIADGDWYRIVRYSSGSARAGGSVAGRLRKSFPHFEFAAALDPDSGLSAVYARLKESK